MIGRSNVGVSVLFEPVYQVMWKADRSELDPEQQKGFVAGPKYCVSSSATWDIQLDRTHGTRCINDKGSCHLKPLSNSIRKLHCKPLDFWRKMRLNIEGK